MGPLGVEGTTVIQLEVLVNDKENLSVVDILEFDSDYKIKSIKAYKG